MLKHERNAVKGDLFTTEGRPYADESDPSVISRGTVMDLLIPIISLIICCVIGMLYTGGFFSGVDFVTAFSESNASLGLTLGSFFGLLITLVLYQVRRVLDFHDCMACIPEGFKAMVPAILILTFAWTLKAMTDSLGADVYVADLVYNHARGLLNFLPAIIFLVGCLLAFATGTSWGHLRHPDPHCGGRVPEYQSGADDHLHFCLHGGSCLRRPLLAHFRHHHHGVCGSPV